LLVKGFAWRQSFYIRFYSGQQGFFVSHGIFLSRDWGAFAAGNRDRCYT